MSCVSETVAQRPKRKVPSKSFVMIAGAIQVHVVEVFVWLLGYRYGWSRPSMKLQTTETARPELPSCKYQPGYLVRLSKTDACMHALSHHRAPRQTPAQRSTARYRTCGTPSSRTQIWHAPESTHDDEVPDEGHSNSNKPRTKSKAAKQRRDRFRQGPPASPTTKQPICQRSMAEAKPYNSRRARTSHKSAREIQPSIERQQNTKMAVAVLIWRFVLRPDSGRPRPASS